MLPLKKKRDSVTSFLRFTLTSVTTAVNLPPVSCALAAGITFATDVKEAGGKFDTRCQRNQ
jgi:hypothetical protein